MIDTDRVLMLFGLFDSQVEEEGTESEAQDSWAEAKRVEVVHTCYYELA